MIALQHFELHVLLALIRQDGESYSVPLVLALEDRLGRRVSQAAVFIALTRLERKGLVRSRLDGTGGARPRRYFRVTAQGVTTAREHRTEHARLWRGMVGRLGRGKA